MSFQLAVTLLSWGENLACLPQSSETFASNSTQKEKCFRAEIITRQSLLQCCEQHDSKNGSDGTHGTSSCMKVTWKGGLHENLGVIPKNQQIWSRIQGSAFLSSSRWFHHGWCPSNECTAPNWEPVTLVLTSNLHFIWQ